MAGCIDESIGVKLFAYELGTLDDQEREEVEIHIIECPYCNEQVVKHQATARLLRHDADVREVVRESHEQAHGASPAREGHPIIRWHWARPKSVFIPVLAAAAALILMFAWSRWHLHLELRHEVVASAKKIAVLPFANLGNPADEYFADGITSEIRSRLAQISAMRVTGSSSTDSYKDSNKDLTTIGRELGVDFVLEGTVRWDKASNASRVRITAQLINVSDQIEIWTGTYDRPLTEMFAAQVEIATNIARALDVRILALERQRISQPATQNSEAYRCYLEGASYLRQASVLGRDWAFADLAERMFVRALKLDTTLAPAYADLSYLKSRDAAWYRRQWGEGSSKTLDSEAVALAEKALLWAPELPKAYWALGYYHLRAGDYAKALEWFREGLRREPSSIELLDGIGDANLRSSKYEDGYAALRDAAQLDPLSAQSLNSYAVACLFTRRCDEGMKCLEEAISLHPAVSELYGTRISIAKYCLGSEPLIRETQELAADHAIILDSDLDPITRDYESRLERILQSGYTSHAGWDVRANYYLEVADAYMLMGDSRNMRLYADSACAVYDAHLDRVLPSDARFISLQGYARNLCWAYALSGRRDQSMQLLERFIAERPADIDGITGVWYSMLYPKIFIQLREYDRAIDYIEYLLSRPSPLNVPYLRVSPYFDPLRNHPRFKKLLEEHPV